MPGTLPAGHSLREVLDSLTNCPSFLGLKLYGLQVLLTGIAFWGERWAILEKGEFDYIPNCCCDITGPALPPRVEGFALSRKKIRRKSLIPKMSSRYPEPSILCPAWRSPHAYEFRV